MRDGSFGAVDLSRWTAVGYAENGYYLGVVIESADGPRFRPGGGQRSWPFAWQA